MSKRVDREYLLAYADDRGIVVATNGRHHLAEMDELWLPILDDEGVRGALEDVGLTNTRFDGDDARGLVSSTFVEVHTRLLKSTVVVRAPGPSSDTLRAPQARSWRARRAAMCCSFERAITDRIRRDGDFRVTTEVVLVRADVPAARAA